MIEWFSDEIQEGIVSTGLAWPASTALLVLVFLYSHYFFASTTAHITAMMGAFLVVDLSLGAPPMGFVLMMAATSSIMMTLTHYATGTSPVIFGKNWMFCWTELGAEHLGIIQSLISTCKLHGLNPYTYLVDVLQRISRHPASEVADLTPRLWKLRFAAKPLRALIDPHHPDRQSSQPEALLNAH